MKDVMGALLQLVSSPKGEASVDEDLKSASVNCIAQLLKSSVVSVREELYSEAMKLPLSHLVFLSLSWTEAEKAPTLRQDCLKLLKTLLEQRTSGFRTVFQGLLPGILCKLAKVCQDPGTIHSSLKALVINVWSGYVAEVFSDDNRCSLEETWIAKAQVQILNQIHIIQSFSSHSDRRIKESMLICAERLINNCWNILDNTRTVVLNVLVVSSLDENRTISLKADTLLSSYIEAVTDMDQLVLEINNKLHSISTDIQHSLGLYSDKVLEEKLSLLLGYLNLLTRLKEQETFFLSKVHLNLLLQNLVRVAQLSETQSSILTSELTADMDFLFNPQYHLAEGRPHKMYRYLSSPGLERLLASICASLGRTESLPIIIQYLLQGLDELSYLRKEAIIILNHVIAGQSADLKSADIKSADTSDDAINLFLPVMYKYLELKPVPKKNVVAQLNSGKIISYFSQL